MSFPWPWKAVVVRGQSVYLINTDVNLFPFSRVTHFFVLILLPVRVFYSASETHVGIRIVQTLAINDLKPIKPS